MTAPDLSAQLDQLLESRPQWAYELQSSPGAPEVWCFRAGGDPELSVSTDNGTVTVYLVEAEQEISLPGVEALQRWLDANEGLFASRSTIARDTFDEILSGRMVDWRGPRG